MLALWRGASQGSQRVKALARLRGPNAPPEARDSATVSLLLQRALLGVGDLPGALDELTRFGDIVGGWSAAERGGVQGELRGLQSAKIQAERDVLVAVVAALAKRLGKDKNSVPVMAPDLKLQMMTIWASLEGPVGMQRSRILDRRHHPQVETRTIT